MKFGLLTTIVLTYLFVFQLTCCFGRKSSNKVKRLFKKLHFSRLKFDPLERFHFGHKSKIVRSGIHGFRIKNPKSAADFAKIVTLPNVFSHEFDLKGSDVLDFIKESCQRHRCERYEDLELWNQTFPEKLNHLCRPEIKCPEITKKYRTFDGTCNNLAHPLEGSALTPQERFIESAYDDHLSVPRQTSVTGHPLPSARRVSEGIVKESVRLNKDLTTLLVFFGQILDHDLSLTPHITVNDTDIKCCTESGQFLTSSTCKKLKRGVNSKHVTLTCASSPDKPFTKATIKVINGEKMLCCEDADSEPIHPACFPIEIPDDDKFYSPFKQKCMEFVRSSTTPNKECTFGAREQINQITAFIDASFLYGPDKETADRLRLFTKGLLNATNSNLLPIDLIEECFQNTNKCLFIGGDTRANEIPPLTIYHTIFMREHNRIAQLIHSVRKTWEDEKIFQEARKILIAQLQNIVFSFFLPLVIGPKAMKKYNLILPFEPDFYNYDENVKPGIRNAFSTAAYRFGHTLLPSVLRVDKKENDKPEFFLLHQKFFKPFDLFNQSKLFGMATGMTKQCAQDFDVMMTPEVTKLLFKPEDKPFGLDLASLNIQRGRDHGLQPYNAYREFCGLPVIKHFNEISGTASCCFHNVYKHVDDIDLFVGGISEDSVKGGIVGETFACLLGKQFQALMKGDRFFFTNGQKSGHQYDTYQINELRKANLARILCDDAGFKVVQENPFLKPDYYQNRVYFCDEIDGPYIMDLIPTN